MFDHIEQLMFMVVILYGPRMMLIHILMVLLTEKSVRELDHHLPTPTPLPGTPGCSGARNLLTE